MSTTTLLLRKPIREKRYYLISDKAIIFIEIVA